MGALAVDGERRGRSRQSTAAAASASRAAPTAQDAAGAVALTEARRLFESGEYERAVNMLDQAVVLLDAQSRSIPAAKDALLTAYELRARAQFSLNKVADARSNFEALLRRSPTHTLSEQVSPRVLNLFEDVRKAVTGAVLFEVSVNDAEIKIDGEPLIAWVDPVTLAEGAHTVTATRPGYSPLTASFTVAPGPNVQSVPVKLERISALLAIVTVPAGVEVSLNGVVRGTTEPGAATAATGTPAGASGLVEADGAVRSPGGHAHARVQARLLSCRRRSASRSRSSPTFVRTRSS